jgi:hypothetical protein
LAGSVSGGIVKPSEDHAVCMITLNLVELADRGRGFGTCFDVLKVIFEPNLKVPGLT